MGMIFDGWISSMFFMVMLFIGVLCVLFEFIVLGCVRMWVMWGEWLSSVERLCFVLWLVKFFSVFLFDSMSMMISVVMYFLIVSVVIIVIMVRMLRLMCLCSMFCIMLISVQMMMLVMQMVVIYWLRIFWLVVCRVFIVMKMMIVSVIMGYCQRSWSVCMCLVLLECVVFVRCVLFFFIDDGI